MPFQAKERSRELNFWLRVVFLKLHSSFIARYKTVVAAHYAFMVLTSKTRSQKTESGTVRQGDSLTIMPKKVHSGTT